MKLLLDESVPRRLASSFPEAFTLRTVQEMGRAGNGHLDTLQRRRPNVENSSALHIGMTGTPGSRDIEVEVRVQPGASRDRVGGFHDGTLRVYVGGAPGTREGEREAAAAPREGAWNRPAKGSIDPGRDLSHEAAPDHRDERGRVPGADAPGVGFLTVDSTHRPVLTRTWVSTPAAGAEPPQPCSAGWPTVGTPVIRVSTTTRPKLSLRPACLPGPAFRPAPIGQPLIVFSRGAASRTRPADLNRTELFLAYDLSADRHPRRRRHRRHLHQC